MATVTKTVLKTYFEQGDIPTQGQYVDLIDSQFGLGETGTQIIQGTISASAAEFESMTMKKLKLPGNGVGSMKVGTTFQIGRTLEAFGSLNLNILYETGSTTVVDSGSFSASGDLTIKNIYSSGHVTASGIISSSDSLVTHFITASGGITSSAGITASAAFFSGNITASGVITASSIYSSGDVSGSYISASKGIYTAGNITSSGNISSSGLLSVDTLTIGATYNNTHITFGDNAFTNNNKAFSITTTLPNIDSGEYCTDTTVTNSSVTTNSVIIASANKKVSVFCHTLEDGSFKFTATSLGSDEFSSAATVINFIVL
jgi:hypothetical protein